MEIKYTVGEGKKAVEKSIEIINPDDLGWAEYCKTMDIEIKLANPNGSQFTDVANIVQIYTAKSNIEMRDWSKKCETKADFIAEIGAVFSRILKEIESKKK